MNILFFFASILSVCGQIIFNQNMEARIVGGKPIDIKKAPYQIMLTYYGNKYCGGSLIKPDTVITAAHCVKDFTNLGLNVRAGTSSESSGVVRNIKSIIPHENFGENLDFDVALLKLDKPLPLSEKIKTVEMVNSDEIISEKKFGFITGWGHLSYNGQSARMLRGAFVPMVNRKKCEAYYSGNIDITNNMICAGFENGGVDSCQGDSGGPLTIDGKLSGIASFGYGCGEPNYPGVYASVAALRDWIDQNI